MRRILIATAAAAGLTVAASLMTAFAGGKSFHAAALTTPPQQAGRVATEAVPGLTWRSGTATLRLTADACPYADLALQLETEGIAPARAYVVDQRDRKSIGCWAKDIGGDVVTMEPGREPGQIPIDWFRTPTGA